MTTMPLDARAALDAAATQDIVQKKVAIDAMRKRVSGGPSEEQKLREACEGFESLFLQKIWEQMRKNVKKEGYLHSRDEEAYQSMFDTELAKKMASAGGIGLGDMLYQQLSQKLTNSSRTTGSGAMREPLPIDPVRPSRTASVTPATVTDATPADLYSEVEPARPDENPAAAPVRETDLVAEALAELAAEDAPAGDAVGVTPSSPAFDLMTGAPLAPADPASAVTPVRNTPLVPMPERVNGPGKARPSRSARSISRPARSSRRSGGITAQPRPRATPTDQGDAAQGTPAASAAQGVQSPAASGQTMPAPAAPSYTLPGQANPAATAAPPAPSLGGGTRWPVEGDIIKGYGWSTEPNGHATWSTGVQFASSLGASVTAPADGVVAFAGEKGGTPHVVLRHADGITSHYTNARALVSEGTTVYSGMEFAKIGVSDDGALAESAENRSRMGFEIRRGELALNPERFLA